MAARSLAAAASLVVCSLAHAGPPFLTDDPEPVDLHHAEINIAAQGTRTDLSQGGTFGAELNYGCAENTQCHIALPGAYTGPFLANMRAGIGDAELGVKYRFVNRTEDQFMAAIYPTLYLPTGNASRGLGNGRAQLLLPLWVQKSWGKWDYDVGLSYLMNPAVGARNSWYEGLLVRHPLGEGVTGGAEIFHRSSTARDTPATSGVNVGLVVKLAEGRNLLASVGRAFEGVSANRSSFYVAYQLEL